jgi:hypothetical protein
MPFVGRPYRRTSRHCADIVNVSSLTESGIRRFSIGLAQGTGLVTDALDSFAVDTVITVKQHFD